MNIFRVFLSMSLLAAGISDKCGTEYIIWGVLTLRCFLICRFCGQRLTLLGFFCWKLFSLGFAHSFGFVKTENIKGIIGHLLGYFGSNL